jgi:outer membrane lipoprotein SlyB
MPSKFITVALLSIASLLPAGAATASENALVRPAVYSSADHAQVTPVVARRTYYQRRRHRARRKTIKRVGIGAAGGAAIGAIAGGGPGAAIGAIAGGGAGALYDSHEKHKGR